MPTGEAFGGIIGRTLEESTPWWPPLPSTPEGWPNIVMVLLDDVGYAQLGCYGSDIDTPTFDRLATDGLRYANFHTTALCSPTRACLLTGRNHHTNGMGRVIEMATGFPGYDAVVPKDSGFLSEILLRRGYATFAVGKWHLTSAADMAPGAPKDKWPLGRGFERFYGFMGGETDQYHPDLASDNHLVDPPRSPEEGYHLTEDLVDHAQQFIKDLRAVSPEKPFFLYFTPGACHAPHQAPRSYIDRYRGHFDQGWDRWREEVFARQVASGLLPEGTGLSQRPPWVPAWDSLTPDEQRLYGRMMEAFAGFLTHTDAEVGRLLRFIDSLGELDDTLVILMSDNGASAEGGPRGSFNEMYFFNFEPESTEENLARVDELGSPTTYNHYPWGWAWAGNTPLRRWKRETHEGGVCDPLVVSWPARFGRPGETRRQYVHVIDVVPTVLEWLGAEAPEEIGGVRQRPIEGVSFAHTVADVAAPTRHLTQYYEMLGSRAVYHDGWKAVVFHPLPGIAYTEADDPGRSFEDDDWELYHVAEDFSELRDLAAEQPARLQALVDLWWSEARRYQALPVTNVPVVGMDPRFRRDRYEYLPGIGALPQLVAPDLRNRSWKVTAELEVPDGGAAGALVCHGSHAGGYVAYVDAGGHLAFAYNFLGTTVTTVRSAVPLPAGEVAARIEFRRSGAGGDVDLFFDDRAVGSGRVERLTPVTFGVHGFTVGYQRGSDISPDCRGRAEFTPGALRRLVVERADRRAGAGSGLAAVGGPGSPGDPGGSDGSGLREDRMGLATQ